MASIIKRKKSYSVVYTYENERGETKQKWETYHSHKDAQKRKAEIENQQFNGVFIPPSKQIVADFMEDFVRTYGVNNWDVSTFDRNTGLIANYINPLIGHLEVQEVNTRIVEQYIQTLRKTPAVARVNREAGKDYVTACTIEKIIKILRCAFKQAVRWEMIGKNPFDNISLPKVKYKKRDIWTADIIRKALDECEDGKLYVAINLAFACSLRIGEILGLTWDNVHIEDKDIANDDAYVYVDKELSRASKATIELLDEKDVYHIFPPLMPNTSTRIILKKPKTETSIRKVSFFKAFQHHLQTKTESRRFKGDAGRHRTCRT